jgi:hypothetical protein
MRFIQLFAVLATPLLPVLALPQYAEFESALAEIKAQYPNISDADAKVAATGFLEATHVIAVSNGENKNEIVLTPIPQFSFKKPKKKKLITE